MKNRYDYDAERQSHYSFDDNEVRIGFIRKVYLILTVQLLLTLGIVAIFVYSDQVKIYVYERRYLMWVAFGIFIVTMFTLACCESFARTTPGNYICLGILTLAMGFLTGIIASIYDPNLVLMALGITAILCSTLSLFAIQTSIDFTGCGAVFLVAAVVLFLFGLITIFFPDKTLRMVYCCGGVFLFSLFLIYDTQRMVGGTHKYAISPEDYVFAALSLYLDIVYIFTFILEILQGDF